MKKFSVEFFNTVCIVLQHYSNTRCFQTLFLLLYIQCVKSETMNNFSVSVHKMRSVNSNPYSHSFIAVVWFLQARASNR